MRRYLINAGLLVLLVAVNVIFIGKSLEFSRVFPFSRLLVGTRLLPGITAEGIPWEYGSRIVRINGIDATPSTVIGLLSGPGAGDKMQVSFMSGQRSFEGEFTHGTVNRDALWFFLFLILSADVQVLWGMLIHMIHPRRYLARLFVAYSLAAGAFTLLLVDLFSFRGAIPLLLCAGVAIGYIGIDIGFKLTNLKTSRIVLASALAACVLLICASFVDPDLVRGEPFLKAFLCAMTLCGLFPVTRLAFGSMKRSNPYVRRRNILIIPCMLAGFLAPLSLLQLHLHVESALSIYAVPLLMLAIPLLVGGRFMLNNFFDTRRHLLGESALLFINIMVAAIGAFLIFILVTSVGTMYEMLLYGALFAAAMIVLLGAKHILGLRVRLDSSAGRDAYAESLQHIAELVSSPAELPAKLERIFFEVRRVMGVHSLQLLLFENAGYEGRSELEPYIGYIPPDSPLHGFLAGNRGIIFRYTLIVNHAVEGMVHDFMAERKAVLIVPFVRAGSIRGALQIGEKNAEVFFTDEEIGYLHTLCQQLYQLIENDRLFSAYLAKRRIERELDIASFIQMRLFPKSAPENKGLHIEFYNRPYEKVTGDYFDFINIDRNRTAIVIGDVSGHGLAASMILSMTSSIINALLMEKRGIERAVQEINHFLNHRYNGVDLITLFIGLYDKRSRELVYINAGHCAPVLIKGESGEISRIEGHSKILGADPLANYYSSRFSLSKDDELILYTDGLVEIYDDKTEETLSEKGLFDILARARGEALDNKIKRIVDYINDKSDWIRDDITVIGIKIL